MAIRYTQGRNAKDNQPRDRSATDFTAFEKSVRKSCVRIGVKPTDTKDILDRKKSNLPYLWCTFKPGMPRRRCDSSAGDLYVLPLDLDGISEEGWQCVKAAISDYRGFSYTTASHKHPAVNGESRIRIVLEPSRPITATEKPIVLQQLQAQIMHVVTRAYDGPVRWDDSVYRPAQIIYLPDERAEFESFNGRSVDVDALLAETPKGEENSRECDRLPAPDTNPVDDLERLVLLDNVNEETFADLRSALWHHDVIADAEGGCGRYLTWIAMGNRLAWFKGTEYEERARELWIEWSAAAPGGDGDAAAAKWDNDALKADRTGYQAIFKRAADNGWINPGSERMKHPVAVAGDFEDLGAVEHEEVKPPRSFPHTGGYGKPGRFLVEGLIPEGSTNVYGASSSFKSYFVISLLCRIAMKNHRWGGRNLKGGAVLYVAAEGGGSVMGRVGAWADKYNNGQPVPLFYTLPLPLDLSVPTNIKAMITEIKRISQATGEPVRIVAIDTLSQSMMQGEENNAGDMAKFIAGATKIYQETGASALIVHHSGKDARKGMRGSSAGFANVDAVIRVERLGEAVNLVNEKQRTGPAQPTRGYNVPAVPLPDEVIAANEAFDEEYTSTEGDVYDPVQLTTERVFEDVPLAEIVEGFEEDNDSEDDAGAKGSCDESWVWEKLEASGGGVNRSVLRELWKDETDKSMGQLRAVLGRMKEKCHIVEYGGVIRTSLGEDVPSGGGEIV